MIKIYPEELKIYLKNNMYICYILCGNDALFLQESLDYILDYAKSLNFNECISIKMENNSWANLFNKYQSLDLFNNKQILLINITENNDIYDYDEKLSLLIKLKKENTLFILFINKLTNILKNSMWFKILFKYTILVNCTTPEYNALPYWISMRAKKMNLNLDNQICHLLSYYYEGNLTALIQIMKQLLLYPDNYLTLSNIKIIINDAAHFTLFHWIDAILSGQAERAHHILKKLRLKFDEPIIFLRNIQKEILFLLNIKCKLITIPIQVLLNKRKLWGHRRIIFIKAIHRLNIQQLYQSVLLMTKIELAIKQDYQYNVWSDIDTITLLLSNKYH